MEVNGYKYTTEQDAIDARELCDSYYGIPVLPNDITQNWVEYNTANLDEPIFYYINFDAYIKIDLNKSTDNTFKI